MTVMMACGHAANGTMNGKPVCAICIIVGDETDLACMVVETPSFEGRMARCSYAMPGEERHSPTAGPYAGRSYASLTPSGPGLAFFEHRPEQAEDRFYCGCWGWD